MVKGAVGFFRALSALHLGDRKIGVLDVGQHRGSLGLVPQVNGLAISVVELGVEVLAVLVQAGGEGPVLLGTERVNFLLALPDDPQRNCLYPPCRQPREDWLPEEGAHLVAHQPVEDPAGLLRLHLLHVQGSGALQRAAHRIARDFVELDTPEAGRISGVPQLFRDVIGDRLTLAIGIGCEAGPPRRPSPFA